MSARKRRSSTWWLLLVAFVVVPLVEIYVIIQVGQVVGAWWTIALLIADSLLGSWLVKREGGRAWQALRMALQQGRMPARELADGILVLAGGILMLSPGFVLDILGILFILPVTRPLGRRILTGAISRRLVGVAFTTPAHQQAHERQAHERQAHERQAHERQGPGPGFPDNGVVQGEVVDEGPDQGPYTGRQPPR